MPFLGLGLHIITALYFVFHAIRTGQDRHWLSILLAFPFLGSLVYLFAVYLPNSRLEQEAKRAVAVAAKWVDPTRELRDARAAFEEVPTAQNQMRVASALLESGHAEQAARQYESCLKGPFASDPEIRLGAGRAFFACRRYADAISYLEPLRQDAPEYRPEVVSLLIARSLAETSHVAQARREFESAVAKFGSFESKAEYAIWAYAVGDTSTANRLSEELDKISSRWTATAREFNRHSMRRLEAARALASG